MVRNLPTPNQSIVKSTFWDPAELFHIIFNIFDMYATLYGVFLKTKVIAISFELQGNDN